MHQIKIANLHKASMDINKSILKRDVCVISHIFNFFDMILKNYDWVFQQGCLNSKWTALEKYFFKILIAQKFNRISIKSNQILMKYHNQLCRGEGQVHCGQLINVKYFFEDDDLSFNHKVYSSNAYNITSIIHDWSHCISFLFIISNDTNNILNVWFIIQSLELCHIWFSWQSLIHA